MATRIAWWLNLDAAFELEQPARYVRKLDMATRVRALAREMRTLIDAHDVLLDETSTFDAELVPLAFCPTPSALAALRTLGFMPAAAPASGVLARVNKRSFCAALGQTLPNAAYVHNLEQLERHVRQTPFTGEWLLKRDFSFAGRERRRVRDGQLDTSTLGFAKNSFARGQGLQVEPYVQRAGDFALHGYLLRDGGLLVGPWMRQECDERGVWQASVPTPPDSLERDERDALEASLRSAGIALQAAGYFGPFGVDAFRYHDQHGGTAFQPRSEVNARFSMGYPRELLERALSAERALHG